MKKIELSQSKIELLSHRGKKETDDFILFLADKIKSMPTRSTIEKASVWIEKHIIITEGNQQGPYRFKNTPYLREIADAMSIKSIVQEIAIMKSNQLGMSMLSFALICYYIYFGIGPMLFVSGDATMAEDTFTNRLDPMIEAAGLSSLIKPIVKKTGRANTGEKAGMKSYAGTFLRSAGPNSEGKLRSFPSRINIVEEIDVFPQNLKGAGNPVEKIVRRADRFGPHRRIYYNSTPKSKISSQIEPLYNAGDKRLFMFRCPECGKQQAFEFDHFHWDENGVTEIGAPIIEIDENGIAKNNPIYYQCDCGRKIKEHEKYKLLEQAEWVPQCLPSRIAMRSYKINAFYSFTRHWDDIILQYFRVKDDPVLYPDFVNDSLASTYEETAVKPDMHFLMSRAEQWQVGEVPEGVLFVTLAADIQADRIEAGVVGWGDNKECWILNYAIFNGDTINETDPCWTKLSELIQRQYTRSDGKQIGSAIVSFIDSGYNTSQVNHFCDQFIYNPRMAQGVYPIKGRESVETKVVCKEYRNDQIATPLVVLADQLLKAEIYNTLQKRITSDGFTPHGYIHFPASFNSTFYEQLTAEDVVDEMTTSGVIIRRIKNIHQRRNEVLDVVKMNLAAIYFMFEKHFHLVNEFRKKRHMKEVEKDWSKFFDGFKVMIQGG